MKLQQLRYFVAIFEEGSFSAGAQRVNATQSGLSMQIRDLEDRYGVKLFTRVSSGVMPTEAGRRFYGHAVDALRTCDFAEQELRSFKGELMGHLRAGLMPTFTRSVLPEVLQHFTERYPLVRVSVIEAYSAQLSQATLGGQLDFAIVPSMHQQDGLHTQPIGVDREYLVSSANRSTLPHRKPVRLRDLAPLRLVLPGRSNARRPHIENYLVAQGAKIAEILEMDAMLGTMELVARSDWMTILPGILCYGDAAGVERSIHPIIDPPLEVSYVLIEPASKSLGGASQKFIEAVRSRMNEIIDWQPT